MGADASGKEQRGGGAFAGITNTEQPRATFVVAQDMLQKGYDGTAIVEESKPSKCLADAKGTDFSDARPPEDSNRLVYMIFFLQGLAMLLPWNTYVTASNYFAHRFSGTRHADNFENIFSLANQVSNLGGFALAFCNGHRFNMRTSVALPMSVLVLTMAVSLMLVLVETVNAEVLFWITVVSLSLCGVNCAFLQLGIFGLAGRFPPMMTQAVMAGQGAAGIFVSFLNVLTTMSEPSLTTALDIDDIRNAAFAYFLITTLVILFTLVAFTMMSRLDFALYYAFRHDPNFIGGLAMPQDAGFLSPRGPTTLGLAWTPRRRANSTPDATAMLTSKLLLEAECRLGSPSSSGDSLVTRRSSLPTFKRDIFESPVFSPESVTTASTPSKMNSNADLGSDGSDSKSILSLENSSSILMSIWRDAATVWFTFLVTLSIFPAVLSQIRSVHNTSGVPDPPAGRIFGDLWVPLLFLAFNVGDTIGRILSGFVGARSGMALALACARICMVPMLLACTLAVTRDKVSLGITFFRYDAWPVALSAALALSNGLLAGRAMARGPDSVPETLKSRAAAFMAFSLQMGLLSGSASSLVLRSVLCDCNPIMS